MPKCPACNTKTEKNWTYCPHCATRLDTSISFDSPQIISGYALDRTRYLWERQQGGKVIFQNFKIVQNLGKVAFKEVEPVRKQLGDFEHINLLNLRKFSFPHLNPNQIYELYAISKLIGYYMANAALGDIVGFSVLIEKLSKTGLFWKIFENEVYQKKHKIGWKNAGGGFIQSGGVDRTTKRVSHHIRECPSSIVHALRSVCFMEVGALCGEAEALFGGIWDGRETKCQAKGDEYNEIEIYLHEKEEKPEIDQLTKEELDNILNEIITNSIERTPIRSKELTDDFYIIADQVLNYYLLSLSPGHAVMSKYAGKICGERIAEKAELRGLDPALSYLEDLFLYLKAGILRSEKKTDRIILKMQESVYAAGVNNIHTNLCIFLAGIIEGTLNKATEQKWDVNEMKCLASGFSECEFWAKKL
ncbi:MAG: hypothetical protein JW778_04610 [Candidatus Altiarchaeota archaeon]|nr:hypothetical protein [Candidatus Altiarchaeota archaeon]